VSTAPPAYQSSSYQAPATPSRPLGVAILAVLIGLYGFIVFLAGLLLGASSAALGGLRGYAPSVFGTTGVLAGVIVAVIGLIILGLAVGLWHLRMWALVLTLLFLAFELVVYGLARDFVSFGFIVALILFVYLLAVNRHFE
jgi:hypothetical protein